MSILEIKNLKKYYGTKKGVENVSLKVEKGEIVGFVGPNGSGKSTTIRCVVGTIFPNEGTMLFRGEAINNENRGEVNKNIGYVPAENAFYEKLTAAEQIEFICNVKNVDKKDIEKYAKLFELDLNVKISKMSFGNRKKVSIVSALLGEPELIIFDEPTNGLDPLIRKRFYEILKELAQSGKAILLSSHNLGEVQKICSKVILIKDGNIIEEENAAKIFNGQVHIVEILSKTPLENFVEDDIKIVSQNDCYCKFEYYGDLNKLIKYLSRFDLENLSIEKADLESIFIHYYEKEVDNE